MSKITMDVVIECSKSTRTKLSQYIKCCGGNLDLVGSGADLEGVSGWGALPPLEFSKYTSRRTIFNISRFSALSVFLYAHFKIFRLASLACYYI